MGKNQRVKQTPEPLSQTRVFWIIAAPMLTLGIALIAILIATPS